MESIESLTDFIAELSFNKLPLDVVNQAKTCLLDTLGVILGGSKTETGRRIIEFVSNRKAIRESSILGTRERTSREYAALANGSLAEILELSDGHSFSGLHQSVVVLPTVLAVGEPENTNGKDIITAIVSGYEVMGRIGRTIHPSHLRKGYIPTGTCGVYAAATAVSKLNDLDSRKIANALEIASYFVPMSLNENYYGPSVKSFHAGHSAQTGMLAASLSQSRFCGSTKALDQFFSLVSEEYNMEMMTEALGEEYEIMNVYFKPYACCRMAHSAIDCILEIQKKQDIDPKNIKSIIVRTFSFDLSRYTDTSSNYIYCQFSLPYIVAVAITDREVGPSQFSSERIEDLTIHKLAKKVKLVVDDELVKIYPNRYPSIVEILTKNGQKFWNRVDIPKGDPRKPLELRELKDKFRYLSSDWLKEEEIENILDIAIKLENLDNINEIIKLLRS
ncbi:MAG: MmgE/PrpD family protein [Candidatus Bathyarchaeota archaeon]|nr:MAG: MmgE/PrpD family protein [Candidatus Bathyarchaeota archaeon]